MQGFKEASPSVGSFILSGAIFLKRNLGEESLCRHLRDLIRKDFSFFRLHGKGNTQGLALCVFTGLEIIEIHGLNGLFGKGLDPLVVFDSALLRKELELPDDGLSVESQKEGCSSLGNSRTEEEKDPMIEVSFFLPKAGILPRA